MYLYKIYENFKARISRFDLGNTELHRRVRAISGVTSNEDSPQSQTNNSTASGWLSQNNDDHSQNGFNQDHVQESFSDKNDDSASAQAYFSGNSEHAYSTASKTPLVKQNKYVKIFTFLFLR